MSAVKHARPLLVSVVVRPEFHLRWTCASTSWLSEKREEIQRTPLNGQEGRCERFRNPTAHTLCTALDVFCFPSEPDNYPCADLSSQLRFCWLRLP